MKDAKGHGSDSKGGSMGRSEFASQPQQGAKFQARQSMKAANSPDSWEARYGSQMDRDRLRAEAINRGVDVGFKSALKEAGLSGGGQPVASNSHAAATLASGSKSAPVDTHPSMASPRTFNGPQGKYTGFTAADRKAGHLSATKPSNEVFMGDMPGYKGYLK